MTIRVTKDYKNHINDNVYKAGEEIEVNHEFNLIDGFYLVYAINKDGVETVDWIDKNHTEIVA